MTRITVSLNGPLKVDSTDATLVDWNGAAYPIARRPFYLCRCGASKAKQFCDGSHHEIEFTATGEPATTKDTDMLAVRDGELAIDPLTTNLPSGVT